MRYPLILLCLVFVALRAAAAPVPLFDGQSLAGWEGDAQWWRVEDGALTGGSRTEKVPRNLFLATTRSFHNFDLRLMLKLTGDAKTGMINSGVQIRSLRVPSNTEMSGYQVDAGAGWWGKMYDESRRNKVIAQAADLAAVSGAVKKDDWNEFRVRAEGPRIQSWINGVAALDYTEADPQIAQDGHIAVQIHSGGMAVVQVKEVVIEELPPTPGAPTWEKLGKPQEKKKPAAPAAETQKRGARDISYNAVATVAKTPEEERATFKLPEGFEVELVAAEDPANGIGKFVPIAFDQRGALWTTTALEYPVDGNENPAAADALYASKAKDKVLVYDRDPSQPTGYASKPRVFADGLAIPLGVLPYKSGCFVQHGHDIVFLTATDAETRRAFEAVENASYSPPFQAEAARLDILQRATPPAKAPADARAVVLTGFGVQDSHLFPHQFLRAPGGWIWMAQGAFNSGKVSQPGDENNGVQFDQTRMAKFRPGGSDFDITSNGPCNIWGLVLNGEGDAFIQEANDLGYPVMPFHEYANYPGCSDRQWKSYAPEFRGTAPDFRMGGTGLSGLALLDEGWVKLLDAAADGAAAGTEKKLSSRAERSGVEGSLTSAGSGGAERKGNGVASSAPPPPADARGSSTPLRSAQNDSVGKERASQTVLVANPITNRIQAIVMHRDGPRWRLDKPTDFLVSSDPWFRPVAITVGPDGCLYIVDWYNKIISHNEVPRNHPDRDKTRGRIWRVRAKAQPPFDVPDFTTLSGDELIAKLGGESLAQSHLAWQAITDRNLGYTKGPDSAEFMEPKLEALIRDPKQSTARRIQALWALQGMREDDIWVMEFPELARDENPALRRAVVRMENTSNHYTTWENATELQPLIDDPDPEVRADVIRTLGNRLHDGNQSDDSLLEGIHRLVYMAKAPLAAPLAPSTRNGKPIKVREAYDREFERYLIRQTLEQVPRLVALLLDSAGADILPAENLLLAALALPPKESAGRVAKLVRRLTRPVGQEEVLRLAQFPDEPGVGEALKTLLQIRHTRTATLEALLAVRTRLDPAALFPILTEAAAELLTGRDPAGVDLGVKLSAGFKLPNEPALLALLNGEAPAAISALRALAEVGSRQSEIFAKLAETSPNASVREDALLTLAASRAPDAPQRALALYPKVAPAQRRSILEKLTATKPGAAAVLAAITAGAVANTDLDAALIDRLLTVLGPDDPTLAQLVESLGALFRPVLLLNGQEDAFINSGFTLEGAFTVETWVLLDPKRGGRQKITNADGILGVPGKIDINFFDAKLRVYIGGGVQDAIISPKPMTPGLWTHVAVTRNAAGLFKLYQDGELVADQSKPAPEKFENVRIAWTGATGGMAGMLAEFRLWDGERSAEQIRATSDRSLPTYAAPGLFYSTAAPGDWGRPQAGAKVIKTSDFPPILTADEAATLDAKYAKFRALVEMAGDSEKGKIAATVCSACHLMGTTGGNIGPNLSGVGAMGTEAILRNILQPNAAMENGYRIYRLEMKNGDLIDALFVSEDKDAVIIRLPGSEDRRIAKTDVREARYLRRSLMPEGLLETMTPEQVSDLFAYFKTLK